jgi:nucleotide-binding universal stress UspA family protein
MGALSRLGLRGSPLRIHVPHLDQTQGPPLDVRDAVVVGCDGAEDSYGALRFAAAEASVRSVRLVVLATYLHPVDPDLEESGRSDAVLAEHATTAARQALCRALTAGEQQLPAHEIVSEPGLPAHVLLTRCGQAQLLVLGTHQRHLLSRLLHGPSTSGDLIHHGSVPVVVVPPAWVASTGRSDGPE